MPALQSKNPIIFVLLTVVIDTIGFGVIAPVLPRLIMQITGTDVGGAARIGGILIVVFAGLQFLFGPLIGNLADRFGRRPVLLCSLFAFGVNYALMGLAPNLTWLFIGRALTGISGAIYAPANAYVADVTPPERRAQSFGLVQGAFGMGFVLGPALGGLLGELGLRAPFFAAAGLAGLNFLYGLFVLPESLPKERRRGFSLARANPLGALRAFRNYPSVLGIALVVFVWALAFQVYPSTWAYYAIAKFALSSAAVGGTLAMSGVSMMLVQGFLTGRLVARFGETRTAPLGIAVGGVVFTGFALITQVWMLYPLLLFSGFQGLAMPSLNALMSKQLGPERQGELQGGMASVMGLSTILGPWALSETLARFANEEARRAGGVFFPGAAFVLAALLALTALSLLSLQLRRLAPLSAARSTPPDPEPG
ncbi:MAG TPA: TCR/Tet family MFS transporter [Polyangiales bacterium]|nr:TCR/Tet family MFS transporter [Polyangiales bacterium]